MFLMSLFFEILCQHFHSAEQHSNSGGERVLSSSENQSFINDHSSFKKLKIEQLLKEQLDNLKFFYICITYILYITCIYYFYLYSCYSNTSQMLPS